MEDTRATFMSLPQEIRDEILSKTNLVVQDQPGRIGSGLHVRDGEFVSATVTQECLHTPRDNCTEVPSVLLNDDNPQLRDQALQVLLSQNHIVLEGKFSASLEWLQSLGPLAKKIRLLDILFDVEPVEEWFEDETIAKDWNALVEYIGSELNLSNLVLSLDHGSCYDYYAQRGYKVEQLGDVLSAYREIIKPLKRLGEKGLKGFYVYWVAFHDNETDAEKYVMGKDYVAKAKIAHNNRNPWFPHGSPAHLEKRDGMDLDRDS